MRLAPALALLIAPLLPTQAVAEMELSLYSGAQSALSSDVSVRGDAAIADSDFRLNWEGRSMEWPLYAGLRATYWSSAEFGYGLDLAHNKTVPPAGELPPGYQALEFTDGLNVVTVNAYRRWPGGLGDFTPYIGGGVGLSIPGVEIVTNTSRTYEYQITGAAASWVAGASYPITDQWSVFGEYKGTYTSNTVDLDTGGTLSADVVTNALNLGVSFSF